MCTNDHKLTDTQLSIIVMMHEIYTAKGNDVSDDATAVEEAAQNMCSRKIAEFYHKNKTVECSCSIQGREYDYFLEQMSL
jgi:hypothetical protein